MIASKAPVLLLVSLLLRVLCSAADFAPEFTSTRIPTREVGARFLGKDNIFLVGDGVQASYDKGISWAPLDAVKGKKGLELWKNPYLDSMAVLTADGNEHFITKDSGKTWHKFALYQRDGTPLTWWDDFSINYNSACADYIELEFHSCTDDQCWAHLFVSKDGLKSVKPIPGDFATCYFARGEPDFDSSVKPETLVCLKEETNSHGNVLSTSLHTSDDFFEKSDSVLDLGGLKDRVIAEFFFESAFMFIYLTPDVFSKDKSEVAISKDLKSFDVLASDLSSEFYPMIRSISTSGIVFSTEQSGRYSLGSDLYKTDSSGLMASRIEGIEPGTFQVSPVSESIFYALEDVSGSSALSPVYQGKVSFDAGQSWQKMEVLNDPECEFKSGCSFHPRFAEYQTSPNIIVSFGTQGQDTEMLVKDVDMYVSRDGGASWTLSLKGPHEILFLDQGNIIVAEDFRHDETFPGFKFSLDQGSTWSTPKLDFSLTRSRLRIRPGASEAKMYLLGILKSGEPQISTIDFAKAFDGAECKAEDLETVKMTTPKDNDDYCFNGHKDTFTRRKKDAKCLVKHPSEEVNINEEACECSDFDYECAPNFKLSAKQVCVPIVAKVAEVCKNSNKKIKLPSRRKIAGNKCVMKNKKESDFIHEVEINCKEIKNDHKNEESKPKIAAWSSELPGMVEQYSYVKSANLSDNILLQTSKKIVFASNNGGQSFVRVPLPDDVMYFLVGPVESTVIIVTKKYLYYSQNGGNSFEPVPAPDLPTERGIPIVFDPSDPKNFIFISSYVTPGGHSGTRAYYTDDAGFTFSKLLDNVEMCAYVDEALNLENNWLKHNLLYCTVADGRSVKLVSSRNYFKDNHTLMDNVLAFAPKPGFVFVAVVGDDMQSLKAKVTVDGETFADADFPSDFQLDKQTAYTILDSSSHSILMHVTTDRTRGMERGALLKSNSNGTSYVLALQGVNRNEFGFVDFDRIDILEGTYIVNTISGTKPSGGKKLKTRISHNDGGLWEFLVPPQKDSAGHPYECVKRTKGHKNALEKCSLNLRSFTQRADFSDTFSSTSAAGYLFGVGHVGEALEDKDLATFMSSDGGVSWKEVAKGPYMWEFGDRGTIFVLVKEKEPTNEILYSTDNGQSWQTFRFTETPMQVLDLATVPSDSARKFMILGKSTLDSRNTQVISIDFTHFFPRQCRLDLDHPLEDDYEYWTPKLPGSSDNCIFGHVSQYLRRAEGHHDCFIGAAPLKDGIKRSQNCSCTVKDYECDYNFYRDADGTCKLVAGLTPQDHKKLMCDEPDTFQYFEPTGYRKLPSSTCVGGKQLDNFNPKPCPGHEKEFNEKNGRNINLAKFLVLLIVPLGAFFGATWFVYERGVKRNGGFHALGQIRLEDASEYDPIEENNTDRVVNRIVKGGIYVAAGAIAAVRTVRKLDRQMLESITGLLFGRRPGRRNYVRVPDDEDELFGDYENNLNDEDGLDDVDFHVDDDPADLAEDFAPPATAADANLFDIDDENTAESSGSEAER